MIYENYYMQKEAGSNGQQRNAQNENVGAMGDPPVGVRRGAYAFDERKKSFLQCKCGLLPLDGGQISP